MMRPLETLMRRSCQVALIAAASGLVACKKEDTKQTSGTSSPPPSPTAKPAAVAETPAPQATPVPASPTPAPTPAARAISLDGGVAMELAGAGGGRKIKGATQATVRYIIRLEDGTEVDRTAEDGPTLKVMLEWGTGMPGLDDALSQMAEGEKATVKIPAAKAWHPELRPPDVPEDANVILEIEVLAVE